MEKKFFKAFDIKPMAKKGDTVFNSVCRFVEYITDKDIYSTINPEKILQLEEVLLNWNKDTEIAVSKEKGKYAYDGMSNSKGGDDYHHYFSSKWFKTRKDALLDLLIQYVHVEYIYNEVRKVFLCE